MFFMRESIAKKWNIFTYPYLKLNAAAVMEKEQRFGKKHGRSFTEKRGAYDTGIVAKFCPAYYRLDF